MPVQVPLFEKGEKSLFEFFISEHNRIMIIHNLTTIIIFLRTPFPTIQSPYPESTLNNNNNSSKSNNNNNNNNNSNNSNNSNNNNNPIYITTTPSTLQTNTRSNHNNNNLSHFLSLTPFPSSRPKPQRSQISKCLPEKGLLQLWSKKPLNTVSFAVLILPMSSMSNALSHVVVIWNNVSIAFP